MSSKLTLGQFLKLASLLDSGAEAKDAVASGAVSVNDEVDTRRGRGLVDGDVVEIGGRAARVVARDGRGEA
ncbi:RNA-binding protein [Dietzia alimentaria]|nr:RNA-binding S4 domain-containing protein [Dietzia sp. SLG510A3-30A2]MBB0993360.1 RNA-binding S4 domain-containing protein [Dietzia sp. SLG510A3-40A3]MBB0998608.1 RNA-binding S4 domain-containing protein [Dietzia maris]MBB1009085.1 RNA-binding S4 domain-containing protein [Dietzia sp. SLG510A3-3B2-2]MBB1012731.1 RNA-binding S4 domain-containing protein [Dietzia kunjamensis]MBB1018253.1 RNA-binding S4 domain-containing protein [Dietzia sp. DQ11-71]MBC7307051.1 RNA-binding S4 domain-containin